jgi:hypothetical protein
MIDVFQKAKAYFQSVPSDPWRWAEDGNVIIWADGSTVAFREEVCEIISRMPTAGLPPFRLIVLILAACRGKFPPSSQTRTAIRESVQLDFSPVISEKDEPALIRVWNDPANQEFSELLARLRLLHQLPTDIRESLRGKAVLIETILQGLTFERTFPPFDVVKALREDPALRDLNSSDERLQRNAVPYRLLRSALQNFSPEALALRMQTGLDALPSSADVDLQPSERARQLLALLRDDPEHQGLAKVARDIMAALYLPRALSETEELALGGFSDIANRGSLDRLLPSELANDDLTLAARVALNEALYIRREPPSNHPPSQLAILMDVGVRQWGLPRVFATAVALAFVAREEHCAEVAIWRAGKTSIEKSDLLSRDGLVKHLTALDTYAHPGAAMKPFFAQFAKQAEMEAVLIANRDSISDPDFRRHLADIQWKRFYIATVDRDGHFELVALPQGQKPVCQAEISLDALFPAGPARPGSRLLDPAHSGDLPLILNVEPFPFLLPVVGRIQSSLPLKAGGGMAVLQDGRLMRWDGPRRGAATLVQRLPHGRVLWVGTSEDEANVHVLKLITASGEASLTTWNAATNDSKTVEFTLSRSLPREVYARDGVLFVLSETEASAWELKDARFISKVRLLSPARFTNGRFYRGPRGEWGFLANDGGTLRLTHLSIPDPLKNAELAAVFDREGYHESGPWMITRDGRIYSGNGTCISNLGIRVSHAHISRDGHKILLMGEDEKSFRLVDLQHGIARPITFPHRRAMYADAPGLVETVAVPPTCSMRLKFTEIAVLRDQEIMLRSGKGGWSVISMAGNTLRLSPTPATEALAVFISKFERIPTPPELNVRLKVATLPNGSRAWLDDRGLLHLKPGDKTKPEVSLTLTDGPMAAGSSDGLICGNPFFLPREANGNAAQILQRVEACCPLV